MSNIFCLSCQTNGVLIVLFYSWIKNIFLFFYTIILVHSDCLSASLLLNSSLRILSLPIWGSNSREKIQTAIVSIWRFSGSCLFTFKLPPSSDLNAEIGNQMCFISTNGNKFLYLFHLPILIMMMLNISFFTTIIIFITKSNHTANFARSSRR